MSFHRPFGSQYLLGDQIGRGAMARVYLARRVDGEQALAVKLLREDVSDDVDVVARFLQEKQLLQSLDHPSIVRVVDLVMDGGEIGIVMELVTGGSLRTLMKQPLSEELTRSVGHQLAGALAAAHAAGITHRDVKPENVLVDSAGSGLTVKLADFGVSRLLGARASQSSAVIGTPTYMPPEYADGGSTSAAGDVYSLGVVLYEALAGRPPFVADTVMGVISAHARSQPERPARVSDPWWSLLQVMLAKDPGQRPSALDVEAALAEAHHAPDLTRLSGPTGTVLRLPPGTVAEGDGAHGREDSLRTVLRMTPSGSQAAAAQVDQRRWGFRARPMAIGAMAAALVALAGSAALAGGLLRTSGSSVVSYGAPSAAVTQQAQSATIVVRSSDSPSATATKSAGSTASTAAQGTTIVVVGGSAGQAPTAAPVRTTSSVPVSPPVAASGKKATAATTTLSPTVKATTVDTTAACLAASRSGGLTIGADLTNSGGPNWVPKGCTSIWLTLTQVTYITYARACLENSSDVKTRCGSWVYLKDGGAWNKLLGGVSPSDRWQLDLKAEGPGYVGFAFSG